MIGGMAPGNRIRRTSEARELAQQAGITRGLQATETRARKERMEYSGEYSSTIGKDGEREGEEKKRKSMPGSRDNGER